MKRTWTIIGAAEVTRSFHWYQSLFGQPKPAVSSQTLEEEPQMNAASGTREFALRDPDGYHVMISSLG